MFAAVIAVAVHGGASVPVAVTVFATCVVASIVAAAAATALD